MDIEQGAIIWTQKIFKDPGHLVQVEKAALEHFPFTIIVLKHSVQNPPKVGMRVANGWRYGGWCINLTDSVVIKEVTQVLGVPMQLFNSPHTVCKPADVMSYKDKG